MTEAALKPRPAPSAPRAGFGIDLAANFLGAGWVLIVQLACIPLVIKFLGVEAYGLFGFYLLMQATLQVLDVGLSPTLNREMARFSAATQRDPHTLNLARTMEVSYWCVGFGIATSIISAAHLIATRWIQAVSIPPAEVQRAIVLMGIMTFFQWPVTFYQGGLLGLRRQVLFNAVMAASLTVAYGGALVVLWAVERDLSAFFLWLVFASILRTALLAGFFWGAIGHSAPRPRVDLRTLRDIRGFAGGVAGIAVFSIAFSQADKLIVSKVLPLLDFSYYSIASMAASAIVLVISATFSASFPRLSALVVSGPEHLSDFYHISTQAMVVAVLPLATVLALFSRQILAIWTRNDIVATNAAPIMALLVIGAAISSLSYIPYALQLAHGMTSPSFRISFWLTATAIPAIFVLAKNFGALGAAAGTILLYAGDSTLQIMVVNRRLLKGSAARLLHWVIRPLAVTLSLGILGYLVAAGEPLWAAAVCIIATASACFWGALLASPLARRIIQLQPGGGA